MSRVTPILNKGANPSPQDSNLSDAIIADDALSSIVTQDHPSLQVEEQETKTHENISVHRLIAKGARYNDNVSAKLHVEVSIPRTILGMATDMLQATSLRQPQPCPSCSYKLCVRLPSARPGQYFQGTLKATRRDLTNRRPRHVSLRCPRKYLSSLETPP